MWTSGGHFSFKPLEEPKLRADLHMSVCSTTLTVMLVLGLREIQIGSNAFSLELWHLEMSLPPFPSWGVWVCYILVHFIKCFPSFPMQGRNHEPRQKQRLSKFTGGNNETARSCGEMLQVYMNHSLLYLGPFLFPASFASYDHIPWTA